MLTHRSHRGLGISRKERLGAVTSLESVFVVDLNANRVVCETSPRHQNPTTLYWS